MTKRNNDDNPRQWRSIEELENDPEFLERAARQFPEIADALKSPVSRRRVLQVMGASLALAGLSGCRWPVEKIAPFAHRPEGRNPGNPVTYATCIERGGYAYPLHVTTIDGRPIKVEGNPLHPASRGAADVFAQASILELYDPDRSKNIIQKVNGKDVVRTWDDFLAFAKEHFKATKRENIDYYVLSDTPIEAYYPYASMTSNTLPQVNEQDASFYAFVNLATSNVGHMNFANYQFQNAEIIVCLDADPFFRHPNALTNSHDFSQWRSANNNVLNRLYVAESSYSLTGALADVRLPIKSCQIRNLAIDIAHSLIFHKDMDSKSDFYIDSLKEFISYLKNTAQECKCNNFLNRIVEDLLMNKRRSIIMAGSGQPMEVHLICHLINYILANEGRTVNNHFDQVGYKYGIPWRVNLNSMTPELEILVKEIYRGSIKTLLIIGGNPVYDAPADIEFETALKKVKTSIHISMFRNETSQLCTWHIPMAHAFESWNSLRSLDGTITLMQPLIEPLYQGKTPAEIIAVLKGQPKKPLEIVKEFLKSDAESNNYKNDFKKSLHDGFVQGSERLKERCEFQAGNFMISNFDLLFSKISHTNDDSLEIVFRPDYKVYDGRYANNAWLQELPDPITRLTWGNAVLMSPATAAKLDVKSDDVVKLTLKGRSIEIPVFVLPGHADGSVSVSLGYGRTAAGRVGNGVGANAYKLRTSDAMYFATGLKVEKTGKVHKLATVQNHHILRPVQQKEIESRAPLLAREADLDEYLKHPDFAKHRVHHPPLKNLWKSLEFDGHRWAMNIDLSRCTGCGACVVACQAENNIPVVGYDQVVKGREMQWLRVDRYFTGGKENPRVSFLPVPCQQCENAPCEQVCPVPATIHTKEGLNDMVYNRCIGMRFCSNNCPYKVRRFNYFYNHKGIDNIEKMKFNPDVTVRSRGVMEKCTYCVQRIQRVKIIAKNEGRSIEDGEITPACAQTCPTSAIVFGDLSDPNSRVSKLHEDPRCYALLEELNVRPRTKYLARLRNPGKK